MTTAMATPPIEVVTYANRSSGMFEQLVHNDFGVPVVVLGWGTVWRGYMDKIDGVLKHLATKADDDIVVFVDGFDSEILRDTSGLHDAFAQFGKRVVISKDPSPAWLSYFGSCGEHVANSGMYMGHTKELRTILTEVRHMPCNDDQRNLNSVCSRHGFVAIDVNDRIFQNVAYWKFSHSSPPSSAYFRSYPGKLSVSRCLRTLPEYSQFSWPYVVTACCALMITVPSHRRVVLYVMLSYLAFVAFFADKSCA